MLSRLAFRAASTQTLVRSSQNRLAPCLVVWRGYTTDKPAATADKSPAADKSAIAEKPATALGGKDPLVAQIEQTVSHWDAVNKIYYGTERDKVNFPVLSLPEHEPPTRHKFVPENWFTFLYEKTGVTGPYCLAFGGLVYVLSKEIWVVEHNFGHFLSFWFMFYVLYKKFGTSIGNYLTGQRVKYDELMERPWKQQREHAEAAMKENEDFIWREQGLKYLFETKRENVDLQLERVYRQRLAEIHQAVKKRLDYQMELQNAQRRIQQQHMVQWIVDQVVKGITPQQERDSLTKCITDLKSLASTAQSSSAAV